MARHDYSLANQTGASFRSDLNNALAAIQSVNSGNSTPGSTVAYQYFVDTSPLPSNPALLKQRNSDNNADILLAEVGGQAYFANGTESKPSISFRNDTDLGLRRNDANKLSIVTNGADRVTVDTFGNVGIGSTSPGARLEVQGDTNTGDVGAHIKAGNGGDTVGLVVDGDNETGDVLIKARSNATAAPVDADTKFIVLGDGKVGVGLVTPTELLHVAGNIKTTGNVANGAPAAQADEGFQFQSSGVHSIGRNTAAGNSVFRVFGGSGQFKILGDGDAENTNNRYDGISDIKLKENIVDANSQWDDIKGIQVRNYNFKAATGNATYTQIGVVAQEIEAVCPGLVKETNDEDASGNSLGTTTKSVAYSVLYMKAVKALQEAIDRIETLEAKVAALEAGN